ncbi:MAG: Zn-ribbon domain-containing OB-fold protein [bacterium]
MAITERIAKTTDLGAWRGEIPMEYIYTMGRAGEKFFRAIKEKGQLLGTRCEKCDLVYVPPRIYCEECMARLENNYLEVSTKGVVHTFTLCYEGIDGNKLDNPQLVAMINLEDTDGGLVHFLGEVEPKDVYIGIPVEAVFKPKKDRRGDILDIKYFKPI